MPTQDHKKCKGFWQSLWSLDENVSSKRIVALVGFVLLSVCFTLSLFVEVKIKEFIWDGMLWIVLGGLGLTVVEKFSNVKSKPPVDIPAPTPESDAIETESGVPAQTEQLNS